MRGCTATAEKPPCSRCFVCAAALSISAVCAAAFTSLRKRPADPRADVARPSRRHRRTFAATARPVACRRDGDRPRGDRPRRRTEPRGLAAASTRRADRHERRAGLHDGRLPPWRQCRPDAGADRRAAREFVEFGHHAVRSDPARPDRSHRNPARTRSEPVRVRRHRRRHPGVHAQRRQYVRGQCQRRIWHLQHQPVRCRSVRRWRPMALHAAGRLQPEFRLQRHRQSREFQLQPGPRRLSQWQRERFAGLHVRTGANAVRPGLLQPHERAVRRRARISTIARSRLCRAMRWQAATV